MADRQFLQSVLATMGVVSVLLAGFLLFLFWAGWVGLLVVFTALGAFLVWFYCGPRPDLCGTGNPKRTGTEGGGS